MKTFSTIKENNIIKKIDLLKKELSILQNRYIVCCEQDKKLINKQKQIDEINIKIEELNKNIDDKKREIKNLDATQSKNLIIYKNEIINKENNLKSIIFKLFQ